MIVYIEYLIYQAKDKFFTLSGGRGGLKLTHISFFYFSLFQ